MQWISLFVNLSRQTPRERLYPRFSQGMMMSTWVVLLVVLLQAQLIAISVGCP